MSKQRIQTKRNSRNKHKWEAKVARAMRVLYKAYFYKCKSKGQ